MYRFKNKTTGPKSTERGADGRRMLRLDLKDDDRQKPR